MVYSSTSVVAPEQGKMSQSQFYYFNKHLFTLCLGAFMMIFVYRIRPEVLGRLSVPLLIFSFILLVLVFTPMGVSAGGARRWLRLWLSTFQPSELAKLAMVIFLARFMSARYWRQDSVFMFSVPVGVMLVFQAMFLKQPDFGAAMSLGILTIGMLFLSGARMKYIISFIAVSLPAVAMLIYREPYRWKRMTSFLDPWKDPRESGFQLIQSYLALGSGGIKGVGLGNSMQKLSFLPEVHTDFIFSIVGEELGFIAAVLVVLCFAFLFIRGVQIAGRAEDKFLFYLASGLSMMIAFQALVNFSVVTGLLPTKGLPLPFISYGGSSLLVNMIAVGILLNISRRGSSEEETHVKASVRRLEMAINRKKAKRAVYGAGL
jgi:cell division protein FtsW